jgi:putative DNA primase/helicase
MTDDAPDNVVKLEKRKSAKEAAKELVPAYSEDDIAEEFAQRHMDVVRFNVTDAAWRLWTGKRWIRDDTKRVFDWTRQLARSISAIEDAPIRRRLGSSKFADGVEKFARADERLVSTFEDWDPLPRRPWDAERNSRPADRGSG